MIKHGENKYGRNGRMGYVLERVSLISALKSLKPPLLLITVGIHPLSMVE